MTIDAMGGHTVQNDDSGLTAVPNVTDEETGALYFESTTPMGLPGDRDSAFYDEARGLFRYPLDLE